MVATAIYSVTMALWKETAFPFCRATERRWKRNVVSRVFSSYHGLRGSASPVLTATGFVNGRWQFSTPHRIHTP